MKLAFAGALQHGFVAVLIISALAVLAAFFLKDLPMLNWSAKATETFKEAHTDHTENIPVML